MNLAAETVQRTIRLDVELHGIDQLASRYYRAQFDGGRLHPLEAIRLLHDGAVLGRGAEVSMRDDELAFDQVRATAPQREKLTLDCWYTTGGSAAQKAKRLNVSRATLYLHWKAALGYFRGRLHEKGLKV